MPLSKWEFSVSHARATPRNTADHLLIHYTSGFVFCFASAKGLLIICAGRPRCCWCPSLLVTSLSGSARAESATPCRIGTVVCPVNLSFTSHILLDKVRLSAPSNVPPLLVLTTAADTIWSTCQMTDSGSSSGKTSVTAAFKTWWSFIKELRLYRSMRSWLCPAIRWAGNRRGKSTPRIYLLTILI